MKPHLISSEWAKRRFDWKHEVNRCPDVPRSAKQFASYICDEFVNRSNGQFFHRKATMAADLRVCIRTIERYLSKLQKMGFLKRVRTSHRERVFQLAFPAGHQMGGSSSEAAQATKLSLESDNSVPPYYNNRINNTQTPGNRREPVVGCVLIGEDETHLLRAWKEYTEAHMPFDFDVLLPKLKRGTGYQFPRRFPPEDFFDIQVQDFFKVFEP